MNDFCCIVFHFGNHLLFFQQPVQDYGVLNTFSWPRKELVVLLSTDLVGPPAEKKRKVLSSSNLIQQTSDGSTLGKRSIDNHS